jgi:hypothetical protein
MTEIELTPEMLIAHVKGVDRVLAFTSRLEIPLAHVTAAEVAPLHEQGWESWNVLRAPGTAFPGLIRAGSFLQQGEWVFWDVHNPKQALTIHLSDAHFAKLVVEVENPETVAGAINEAIRPQTGV